MVQTKSNQFIGTETDSVWNGLYRLGGICALAAVLIGLMDIVINFIPGGEASGAGTRTAANWFILYQDNWLLGLRSFGILNVINLTLLMPVFLALYASHRRANRAYAVLAAVFFFTGAAVYIANNTALPMLALSTKYGAAATEAQRSLLAAAGEAMLARGEDFTPGAFVGFLFTEIASISISFVILRSRIFSKAAAYTGISGFVLLTVFTIWSTFIPVLFDVAMIFAILGGLLSLVWYILIAGGLFRLGGSRRVL